MGAFFSFLFSKITPLCQSRRKNFLVAEGGRKIFLDTPPVYTPPLPQNPCPTMLQLRKEMAEKLQEMAKQQQEHAKKQREMAEKQK